MMFQFPAEDDEEDHVQHLHIPRDGVLLFQTSDMFFTVLKFYASALFLHDVRSQDKLEAEKNDTFIPRSDTEIRELFDTEWDYSSQEIRGAISQLFQKSYQRSTDRHGTCCMEFKDMFVDRLSYLVTEMYGGFANGSLPADIQCKLLFDIEFVKLQLSPLLVSSVPQNVAQRILNSPVKNEHLYMALLDVHMIGTRPELSDFVTDQRFLAALRVNASSTDLAVSTDSTLIKPYTNEHSLVIVH